MPEPGRFIVFIPTTLNILPNRLLAETEGSSAFIKSFSAKSPFRITEYLFGINDCNKPAE